MRRKVLPQDDKTRGVHRRPSKMNSFVRICLMVWHTAFTVCYTIGALVIRLMHRTARTIAHAVRPIGVYLRRLGRSFADRVRKRVKKEKRLAEEDRLFLGEYIPKIRETKNISTKIGMYLKIPLFYVYHHRKTVFQCLTLLSPVVAALILYATLQYWSGVTFGLAVQYQGKELGYISDEAIFASGVDMASGRIIHTEGDSFQVERTPRFTLALVQEDEFLDENDVCDMILQTSGNDIAEMSGLYINGTFEGAVESRTELDALLQGILDKYLTDNPVTNTYENAKVLSQKAEFMQSVEVLDGLYPVSASMSIDAMKEKLTKDSVVNKFYTVVAGDTLSRIARVNNMTIKQLYAINPDLKETVYIGDEICVQRAQPFLRVQVVQEIQYNEEIPFESVEEKSGSYYKGYKKIKTTGVKGQQQVTAQITLVDGMEESHTVTNTVVTKKPVSQVTIVGTKQSVASGSTVGSGNFIWPVPYTHYIYSGFGWRSGRMHKGIDISAGGIRGKAVLAADGGKVIETYLTAPPGFSAYGRYVLIDHGNGFVTMYAHCDSIYVKTGDRVSQGQTIGAVGNTGRSTGPHLHFEIRYRGQVVNPTNYVR